MNEIKTLFDRIDIELDDLIEESNSSENIVSANIIEDSTRRRWNL